jgi:hypothetical protein
MNRKPYLSISAFTLVCLTMGLLTSCTIGSKKSSSTAPAAIAATSPAGGTESAAVGATYGALSATVTDGSGAGVSGVSVVFAVVNGASGASASFATGGTTDTETTNSSGVATTSQALTAGTVAGTLTVTATASGASIPPATFTLTNTASAPATLTATSGQGQSATVSTAFANPLIATVTDANSNPVQGVSVTFTAPASGASGTFANGTATETDTTDVNGNATSSAFTANSTAGGPYNVVASSTGLTSVNFAETNTTVVVSGPSNNYVFYASGEEAINAGPNYYAVAGAVTIDANGNILGGEQDYNDAFGITATDTISAVNGALVAVDASAGLYTLTITTTDVNLGTINTAPGVEEFVVQFVNSSHALITQFDGSATSSGSLDLQTTTSASNGSYAFTAAGVDNNTSGNYASVAIGGVVTANSGGLSGVYDIIDAGTGTTVVSTGNTITAGATLSGTDTYGRGTLTGSGMITASSVFAFYVVGPATGSQALRIIDMDANDVAIGSAYGQGSATFTNATFPTPTAASGVLTLLGQWSEDYATLGEFTADSTNGTFSGGAADDNELDNSVQMEADSISGSTYNLVGTAANGYGTMAITWGTAGPNVSAVNVYMVDPALNINDPNNTTSTDVGGALLLDLDVALPGGVGVITPQTDTTVADFNGTYVAGFQNFNEFNTNCFACEFDMISQGTMTTGAALSLTGADSDPFGTWDGTAAESAGDTFTSTPLSVSSGFYSMSVGNNPENPIDATINTFEFDMDSDIYQASATTLYWLEIDSNGVFLGPIVAQGSLTGVPLARKPGGQTQPQPNKNIKPNKGLGVRLH